MARVGRWVQVTSPPPSHLHSESVHAGRKQRIKEFKRASKEQEEKLLVAIVEALEKSIWKRYQKASSMYVCMYACRLNATCNYTSLLGLLPKKPHPSTRNTLLILVNGWQRKGRDAVNTAAPRKLWAWLSGLWEAAASSLHPVPSTRVTCVRRTKVVLHTI